VRHYLLELEIRENFAGGVLFGSLISVNIMSNLTSPIAHRTASAPSE